MRALTSSNPGARRERAWPAIGCAIALAMLAGSGAAAATTPSVTEYVGGVTPGFTANSGPDGIAAGPDGNLWFVEENAPGRVTRITPGGAVTEFEAGITPNSGVGEIAAGADGNLWFVAETDPGRIGRISTTGVVQEFTGGVATGFTVNSFPEGITAGPDGNVWFSESADPGRIAFITPAGVVTEFQAGVAPGFTVNSNPEAITTGPHGNLWFIEGGGGGRIARITPAGIVTEFTAGLTPNSSLVAIAPGPDGNLWFTGSADPGRIGRITPAGAITEFTGGVTPGFSADSGPEGIVAGPDGNLWFAARSDAGRIGRVTPAGEFTEFAAGATPGFTPNGIPNNITVGPDGNLWFTSEAGRVSRFTTAPVALTGDASGIGPTSATVAGTANGHAQPTTAKFEVGPLGGATTATPDQSIGSGFANSPVSAQLTGLTPNTTYRYRLLATNPTDTTAGAFRTFTTAAGPSLGPPPLALAAVSDLRVTPRIFRAADRGGSIAGRRKRRRPIGTRVSYRDSQDATTTFTVLRPRPGVRRGRRCVRPPRRRGGTRRRRCTRFVSAGSFTRADRAGVNRFRFTGRVRRRKLRPGRYRLRAVPRFAGRNGTAATTSFRIVG